MPTETFPREETYEAVADGLASQEYAVINYLLADAECREPLLHYPEALPAHLILSNRAGNTDEVAFVAAHPANSGNDRPLYVRHYSPTLKLSQLEFFHSQVILKSFHNADG